MKQWCLSIIADHKTFDKRLEADLECRTKKEAIELMDQLNARLNEPPASEGSMVRLDYPADGRRLPRTIYLNPADYSFIDVAVFSKTKTDGYKGKIGFQSDDKSKSTE